MIFLISPLAAVIIGIPFEIDPNATYGKLFIGDVIIEISVFL